MRRAAQEPPLRAPLRHRRAAQLPGLEIASVTRDQVREIAQTKMPDLNANDIEAAMKIVEGTARSMGVTTS